MIIFDAVSKRYGDGQTALIDVSFQLGRGEIAFVTGHSGAGKSTLLKLILALEPCSAGRVFVDDVDIGNLSRRKIPYFRRKIGAVFQDHQLLMDRTVGENVALPLEISGFPARDTRRRVRAALDKVGLLTKERLYPASLSGGEQQRIGIARAVVNRPRVILADEPTGNLDPELSAEVLRVFEQFKAVGVSLLVATHDTSLIKRFPYRVLHLDEGELIDDSTMTI